MIPELSTLSACCDIAEQMLLRCFQHLNSSGTTLADFDKTTVILARVTAVRKSLIHLSDRDRPEVGRVSDPPPPASASDDSHPSPSGIHPVQQIRATPMIRDIAALPPDRIEHALARVFTDLAESPCASEPPEPVSTADSSAQRDYPSPVNPLSPERTPHSTNHPSTDTS